MPEDSAGDLYENALCGNLTSSPDGTIAKVNATLLGWLGYTLDEVAGRKRFGDLLTMGARIYYETHLSPLLAMQGEISGVALDLRAKDGSSFPVLVSSLLTRDDGRPGLIRTIVFDGRERRAYEQELLYARQAAERETRRLRHLVADLQRSLLPAVLQTPPGLEAAAHYRMASVDEVGGDFYDLFPLDDDRWGFFLGDVSGKGIDAATVTSLARYTLRAAAVYDPDPAAVLHNLNRVLYQEYRRDARYCTVVFGILTPEPAGFRAVLASGGHPEPLVLRAGGTVARHPTKGRMVGVFPDSVYTNTPLTMRPGDTLVLHTDGLNEARTTRGASDDDRFGLDAVTSFAADRAPASATAVVEAFVGLLDSFDDGLDDDTAVMAIGVPDPGVPPPS
ncbi:PP2C family protein-serine/threonine phosphatase [Actinoplanes sp. M2I2]|uniref:PP2C family protein-serine/threonine phosphatase n=1 Tax=Actinoplanes sp. M2I2 TaxID=1734444 RepID=UPI002020B3C8|nr:SpoIIE family protein phosphatase [Actinoplanes sp. M2I2]